MPWRAFTLTAKTGSISWGKMSLLRFSNGTVQSLRLLKMAGEVWRKKTKCISQFVYRSLMFSAVTVLSTVLN